MKAAYLFDDELMSMPEHVRNMIAGAVQAYTTNKGPRQLAALNHAISVASSLYGLRKYSPQEVVAHMYEINHEPVK